MPTLITDIPFDVLFELKKYLDLRSLIRLKLTSNHFWEWGKLNESKIAPSFVEIQSIINHTNDVTSISNACSSLSDYASGSISQNIPVKFQPSPKFDWTYILSLLPFSCRFCQCSIRINFLNIFLTEKLKWVSINYCDKHNNFISSETFIIFKFFSLLMNCQHSFNQTFKKLGFPLKNSVILLGMSTVLLKVQTLIVLCNSTDINSIVVKLLNHSFVTHFQCHICFFHLFIKNSKVTKGNNRFALSFVDDFGSQHFLLDNNKKQLKKTLNQTEVNVQNQFKPDT